MSASSPSTDLPESVRHCSYCTQYGQCRNAVDGVGRLVYRTMPAPSGVGEYTRVALVDFDQCFVPTLDALGVIAGLVE